jgi:site-specific recombinase XerD
LLLKKDATAPGKKQPPDGKKLSPAYQHYYHAYLGYAKMRRSRQAYATIRKITLYVFKWFDGEHIPLKDVTARECIRYKNMLAVKTKQDGTPLSTGTMRNRLKAGKSFFKYLVITNVRAGNPFEGIQYPRLPEHLSRNCLNEAQMGSLLGALKQFGGEACLRARRRRYRCHVLAEVLYATGLRISEAAALRPEHIDIRQRLVTVKAGKGNKDRMAFLTRYAADVLEVYVSYGRKIVVENGYKRSYSGTVFGTHPERLTGFLNGELRRVCGELGLPVITSHGFRHSLGTHLHRAGCDMRYIQMILGHESLSATQIYTKITKDELKQVLDNYHPRKG